MPRKKRIMVIAAAIMIVIIAAAAVLISTATPYLDLFNSETGEVYASWKAQEGLRFSVEFIHSVNKSPVSDHFILRDGEIWAEKTVFSSFGAGMPSELGEGQTLTYNDDGTMTISGFDLKFPQVNYIVGTVSDHTLTIADETISLRELCGRNTAVVFRVRHGFIHKYI